MDTGRTVGMDVLKAVAAPHQRSKTVAIVGLGNIGSHLVSALARTQQVGHLILVDFDDYETKNVATQDIVAKDIGSSKVQAQQQKVEQINPSIRVTQFNARIEEIPVGLLHPDLFIAGLDSRVARQYLNEVAWRLGTPWIDTAVDAADLLARVNVYVPHQDGPCLECSWDKSDYAAIEQSYPCGSNRNGRGATNAPASLGSLTAGIASIECQKLLAGDVEYALLGRQLMLDLRNHTHYVTEIPANKNCRFDHETWEIQQLPRPSHLAIADLIPLVSGAVMKLCGHRFIQRQYCPNCEALTENDIFIEHRVRAADRWCLRCGQEMTVRGFDMTEWIDISKIPRQCRTLQRVGFRTGDVVTIQEPYGSKHFQLGGA